MSLQVHLLRKSVFSVRVRVAPLVQKQRFEQILNRHEIGYRNPAAAVYELDASAEEISSCLDDDDVEFVGFG